MKVSFKKALIWFAAFIVFTALVLFIDVKPAGHPVGEDVKIGFASLNISVFEKLFNAFGSGVCEVFYKISQFCGLVAIAVCICMALSGLSQLFRRKGLHFVDSKIIAMGIFYVIVAAFYVLFLKVAVNYRPVYVGTAELEASYPSSHTMLALTVVGALIQFTDNFSHEEKKARLLYSIVCKAFIVIAVATRFLSCVHWTTDIIGSVILSMALISLYEPLVAVITNIHNRKESERLVEK